jgi:uncharacterized protein YecE (DUF72 family)
MMLAFGRAHEAVVEFALLEHANEAEARQYIAGTEDLPRKMRRLFRDKIDRSHFVRMDHLLQNYSEVASKRHHLIHGEWWFDPFNGGRLVVRRLHRDELTHDFSVTPFQIEKWAESLEEIAEGLELVWDAIRMERDVVPGSTR